MSDNVLPLTSQPDTSGMTEEKADKMDGNPPEDISARSVKRKWGADSEVTEKPSQTEPVEKRQAFKLTPPTLIHGVAKPAPKDEVVAATQPKKSFLRPSRLGPPTVSQSSPSTTISTVSSPLTSETTKLQAARSVSSNNPFLKQTTDEDGDVSPTNDANYTPQENGCSDRAKSAASDQENSFLKMTTAGAVATAESPSPSETSGFVFGHKMEERVVKTDAENESKEEDTPSEFVFGANLSERVKISVTESGALQTAPAESAIFKNDVKQDANGRELEASAAVLFNASNTKVIMPEVEIKTGEEDEKNVLQVQCKLYQYDSSSAKNWIERGRGNLRLNDRRISALDRKFQSRLVMRTNGSLRLILNTKIWAGMVVEKADSKSVRISAQAEDAEIGVFLIVAPINDADPLFRAIEYRVLHLKQLEEKASADASKGLEAEKDNSQDTTVSDSTVSQLATKQSECAADAPAPTEAKNETREQSVIVTSSTVTGDSGFTKDDKVSE